LVARPHLLPVGMAAKQGVLRMRAQSSPHSRRHISMLSVGASAQVTTATAQQPVIGYVLSNRGLMAGITLDGTRITRLDL
jgi:hypothetical protein